MRRNRRNFLFIMFVMAVVLIGCSGRSEGSDADVLEENSELYISYKVDDVDAEDIGAIYGDIYHEAVESGRRDSLDITRRIVSGLGDKGYAAVDGRNQVDMAGARQVREFCKAVEERESAELTIIVVMEAGFRKLDLKTENGTVNVVSGYYQYDQSGYLQNRSTVSYPVSLWKYTEEGYLIFEGSYFSEDSYVLTLSDMAEHTALRVQPLAEKCRELNRKYLLPVGYERNNVFLCDWKEGDYGELNFYDVFDGFYPVLHGKAAPYNINGNSGEKGIFQVPEREFEGVIRAYFSIDRNLLRSRVNYVSKNAAYEYRPRGFEEAGYSEIPYPEVVGYRENQDGTVTLMVNAVYPYENTSRAFRHETVIRPLNGDRFQYVSNRVILPEEGYDFWWHSDRLAEEDGEKEGEEPEPGLEDTVLTAAEQLKEVYREIELTEEPFYGSGIKEFTREQCREVVSILGKAGYVSVTEDTNMENYEKVEAFYRMYQEKRDAEVTIYNVNPDGFLGAVTFLYKKGKLQTYFVGIGWKEGGISEIRETSVREIEEINLTEKGYFIYQYKDPIAHSSLRQYWRIKPLSDKCRELTAKYVYGLSYVNYNVLVTNWDKSNVEDILMPRMFEDIYRIHTGENLKPENWKIPAETYEKIMTIYFPVSTEQLREKCGYDEKTNSYEYEMIFPRQYPPFGEVVDYRENTDGTITLTVDGVWADYNSDLAFTNTLVVQPFEDGTFRYLSNSIEPKEMELPPI